MERARVGDVPQADRLRRVLRVDNCLNIGVRVEQSIPLFPRNELVLSSARRCQRQSRSRRHGLALISTATDEVVHAPHQRPSYWDTAPRARSQPPAIRTLTRPPNYLRAIPFFSGDAVPKREQTDANTQPFQPGDVVRLRGREVTGVVIGSSYNRQRLKIRWDTGEIMHCVKNKLELSPTRNVQTGRRAPTRRK
jgi:hypothetical protein